MGGVRVEAKPSRTYCLASAARMVLYLLLRLPRSLVYFVIAYCHPVCTFASSRRLLASATDKLPFLLPHRRGRQVAAGATREPEARGAPSFSTPAGPPCLKHHPSSHPLPFDQVFPASTRTPHRLPLPPRRRPGGPRSTARLWSKGLLVITLRPYLQAPFMANEAPVRPQQPPCRS